MKKQKFFHLTFYFENFDYSFGRNVLSEFLFNKFPMFIDDGGCDTAGELRAAEMFKRQHPNIAEITLIAIPGKPHFSDTFKFNYSAYAITQLA